MGNAVSAADANRQFSKLLGQVREGRAFVITSHGRPVATIAPIGARDGTTAVAKGILLDRLRAQPASPATERWTRSELYED